MANKLFNIMYNVGRAKYVINTHDGVQTYPDGSTFFGIEIFKNKKVFEKRQKELTKEGYAYGK